MPFSKTIPNQKDSAIQIKGRIQLLNYPFLVVQAVDYWALGCMIFEMVTNTSPFNRGDDPPQVRHPPFYISSPFVRARKGSAAAELRIFRYAYERLMTRRRSLPFQSFELHSPSCSKLLMSESPFRRTKTICGGDSSSVEHDRLEAQEGPDRLLSFEVASFPGKGNKLLHR